MNRIRKMMMPKPDTANYLADWLKKDGKYKGYFEIDEESAVELATYILSLEHLVEMLAGEEDAFVELVKRENL